VKLRVTRTGRFGSSRQHGIQQIPDVAMEQAPN